MTIPVGSEPQAPRPAWITAAVVVVAGVAAAGAWVVFSTPKTDVEPQHVAPEGPVRGKTYLAAKHIDPSTAKLSAAAGGKGTLELVLQGAVDGEHLLFTFTQPLDPTDLMVFVQKGDPTTKIGLLSATTTGTGNAGETAVKIDLETLPSHITVIDLRWDGGKWEGFEIRGAAGSPK